MGSKLSQYDYSILTLKCVNLIQEKTNYSQNMRTLFCCPERLHMKFYFYIFIFKYIISVPLKFGRS